MTKKHNRNLSRREFIKLAAAVGLLAGCNTNEPPAAVAPADTPTAVPLPTNTNPAVPPATATTAPTVSPPTPTSMPTATPHIVVADPTDEIINTFGKVVHTRHAGVWDGDHLSPEAINQMLDASITNLTGLNDATEAWAALFKPNERIAIKINTISGSRFWTHVPLVTAVTEQLQNAGVPAEQIVVFDRYPEELEKAGFTINKDGPGVRCYGTDYNYVAGWSVGDDEVKLSSVLLDCDALINIPILKQHGITGLSFAMKNHYGTIDRPSYFHGERAATALPQINALAPIKDRARLIIGDVFDIVQAGWGKSTPGDAILMSFDPVAHDTLGLQIYNDTMAAEGNATAVEVATRRAGSWLRNGAEMGLGIDQIDQMDVVDVELG